MRYSEYLEIADRHKIETLGDLTDAFTYMKYMDDTTYGVVYFAVAGGKYMKIGHTTQYISNRINALQTGCPLEIELITTFSGSMEWEKFMHELFKKFRIRDNSEWFHYLPKFKKMLLDARDHHLLYDLELTDKNGFIWLAENHKRYEQ